MEYGLGKVAVPQNRAHWLSVQARDILHMLTPSDAHLGGGRTLSCLRSYDAQAWDLAAPPASSLQQVRQRDPERLANPAAYRGVGSWTGPPDRVTCTRWRPARVAVRRRGGPFASGGPGPTARLIAVPHSLPSRGTRESRTPCQGKCEGNAARGVTESTSPRSERKGALLTRAASGRRPVVHSAITRSGPLATGVALRACGNGHGQNRPGGR